MRGRNVGVIVAVVLAVCIGLPVLGLASDWFGFAAKKVSPQNVENQFTFAYDYNNSLDAAARNYCGSVEREAKETNPDYKSQIGSQTQGYLTNFNSIRSQYNAALSNAFKAKYIKPADVPTQAPTLEQKVAQLKRDESLKCGDVGDGVKPQAEVPGSTPGN